MKKWKPKTSRELYKMKSARVSVLLSGGIDSAACVQWYVCRQYNVVAIFVDYGQPAVAPEWASAKNVAEFYKIPIFECSISCAQKFSAGEIRGRHAALLF